MIGAAKRWVAAAPLARIPVGWKLIVLAGLGASLAFVHNPWILAAAGLFACCALLATEVAPRVLWGGIRGPAIIVGWIGLFECWSHGLASAGIVTARLLILIGFAQAVTASSSVSAMTAAIEAALWPLQRIGLLNAERAGLTLTLTIRFVPLIVDEIAQIREAQAMRGLDRSIVALAVPLVVRIILRAQDLADAIDLRGPPPRSGQGPGATAVVTEARARPDAISDREGGAVPCAVPAFGCDTNRGDRRP
ncbi:MULTISPECIES: energy-coupling factor transporter transmembrane component T [Rhodopseudomonas]|uniref:energy-coupling factor transporter transmembrane component T family protein n=1 Tax=Rhodopseudomonas TaxID=1073 RepID=UPI0005C866D4|nr:MULTISPECIES: energy-coupling factor transporter transmembrane component T [Rhodopseudomonas]MDF3812448.1 energy-coupling factor transporter transmembrane component T [Rhodopseudomonas sp. BAL398]WOK19447.1 energy-coupling factor transporter transmembrane component T [Rhodopseudomonas sp. BAL398]